VTDAARVRFLGTGVASTIHQAGEVRDGQQRCSRCGCNLPPGPDEHWLVRGSVEVVLGGRAFGTLDEPNCQGRLRSDADPSCPTCIEIGVGHGPSHTPSRRCESGRRPHCSCPVCFG
jgi:hypothetical protein